MLQVGRCGLPSGQPGEVIETAPVPRIVDAAAAQPQLSDPEGATVGAMVGSGKHGRDPMASEQWQDSVYGTT
jgi:hypothetical protein